MDRNSVIFGVGLGFIILGLVLYAGSSFLLRPSDKEIMSRASELGMVQAPTDDEIVALAQGLGMVLETGDKLPPAQPAPAQAAAASQTPEPNTVQPEISQTPATQPEELQTSETSQTPDSVQRATKSVVTVRIPEDTDVTDAARILEEDGVVEDASDFTPYLREAAGGDTLEGGLFILPVGEDYDRILDILFDR